MLKSLIIFLITAACEVIGGYLMWIWIKDNKHITIGIIGMLLLILYGAVATMQNQGFGRVYAAYGGIFIVFSLVWALYIDGFKPDKWDIIGAIVSIIGTCIIMYAPR